MRTASIVVCVEKCAIHVIVFARTSTCRLVASDGAPLLLITCEWRMRERKSKMKMIRRKSQNMTRWRGISLDMMPSPATMDVKALILMTASFFHFSQRRRRPTDQPVQAATKVHHCKKCRNCSQCKCKQMENYVIASVDVVLDV